MGYSTDDYFVSVDAPSGKNSPQKFWMVCVQGTPTTEKRHPSLGLACEEADRVARQTKNIGKKVYVLEAMDYRWVSEPPLTYVEL